jgi:hypothetical protein
VVVTEHVQRRWRLVAGGTALFGAWWGTTLLFAGLDGRFAIPVAGPLLVATDSRYVNTSGVAWAAVDTAFQSAGLLMALVGLLTTEKVQRLAPASIAIAPGPAGFVVAGRF